MNFSALEIAVLKYICENNPSDRVALEAQLETANVLSRENTGHGFFTKFEVEKTPSGALASPRLRDGPLLAKIDGLEHGMGFILWLTDGFASQLEGYAYGDESTLNLDFELIAFDVSTQSRGISN